MSEWKRVTARNRCPICDKPDWCSVSDDETVCICMRIDNGTPTKNGGWLHRLKYRPVPMRTSKPPTRKVEAEPRYGIARQYAAMRKRWDWRMADGEAMALGVSAEAIERLQPGYLDYDCAVAYPMRSGFGTVVGIRFRNYDGDKWAARGSREGLFFDASTEHAEEVVIVEGTTDTVAALSIDLCAVGRPSCKGCVSHLVTLLMRWGTRRVTIVADNDKYRKSDTDGKMYNPGIYGATELAQALGLKYRIIVPPAKDIRAWVNDGATPQAFKALADNSIWRTASK